MNYYICYSPGHGELILCIYIDPANYLDHQHHAEHDLNGIVHDQGVLQFERLSVFHVLRTGIQAKVQVGDQNRQQRSGSTGEQPGFGAWI